MSTAAEPQHSNLGWFAVFAGIAVGVVASGRLAPSDDRTRRGQARLLGGVGLAGGTLFALGRLPPMVAVFLLATGLSAAAVGTADLVQASGEELAEQHAGGVRAARDARTRLPV